MLNQTSSPALLSWKEPLDGQDKQAGYPLVDGKCIIGLHLREAEWMQR